MSKRTRAVVMLVAGALVVLVALGADVLGLGGHPGIGWKQVLGTLVGAGVAVAGGLGLRG